MNVVIGKIKILFVSNILASIFILAGITFALINFDGHMDTFWCLIALSIVPIISFIEFKIT